MACFFLTFASASARGAVGLKAQGRGVGAGSLQGGRFRLPGTFQIYFKINLENRKGFLPLQSQTGREDRTGWGKANGAEGAWVPETKSRFSRSGTDRYKCRTVRGRRESSFKIYNM